MGKSHTKNCFFNTQKLDHDRNKIWVCIPWTNYTFQLVTARFQKNRSTILLNAPLW